MKKNKSLTFKPYTSIVLPSLMSKHKLLKNILNSEIKIYPRKIDKPIVLYGAGTLGKMAKEFFDYFNIPYLFIVDKNANHYQTDKSWQDIQIIHPKDVKKTDKKDCLLVICAVTTPLIALQNDLKKNGWTDTAFFYDVSEAYRDRYPLSNGWFLGKLNDIEKKSIEKVFSLLSDDYSRDYYLQFLAWRKLRVELIFAMLKINNENRFFIPEFVNTLKEDEIFVDCGAHKGNVIEKFIKLVDNKYKAIYAFEPDNISLKILKAKLSNISNIKTLKYALSNKKGEERFSQGFDFASKIDKRGKVKVETTTLDNLNIPTTFIKMHLEGGELNALRGSKNTIKRYRPKIAITIYHNSDGVWRIPLFLIDNTNNYKYYIRLHAWGGTGAVFYAISKKRN